MMAEVKTICWALGILGLLCVFGDVVKIIYAEDTVYRKGAVSSLFGSIMMTVICFGGVYFSSDADPTILIAAVGVLLAINYLVFDRLLQPARKLL